MDGARREPHRRMAAIGAVALVAALCLPALVSAQTGVRGAPRSGLTVSLRDVDGRGVAGDEGDPETSQAGAANIQSPRNGAVAKMGEFSESDDFSDLFNRYSPSGHSVLLHHVYEWRKIANL